MSWVIWNILGALLAGAALVVALTRVAPPMPDPWAPHEGALRAGGGAYEASLQADEAGGARVALRSPGGELTLTADAVEARVSLTQREALAELITYPEGAVFRVRDEGGAIVLEAWRDQAPTLSFVGPDGALRRRYSASAGRGLDESAWLRPPAR